MVSPDSRWTSVTLTDMKVRVDRDGPRDAPRKRETICSQQGHPNTGAWFTPSDGNPLIFGYNPSEIIPMSWRFVVLVSLALVAVMSAQSAILSDDQVEAAIAAAKQTKYTSLFVEARGPFAADHSVLIQGPVGRTMDLAREAFDRYKPFKVTDVPPAVRTREISFLIVRHSGTIRDIKNFVIMPPGATSRDSAIQPLPPARFRSTLTGSAVEDVLPRTWRPGLGSEPSGFPLSFRFSEDALPPGDLRLIVVTDLGDERFTVRAQDRDRIR